RPVRRGELEQCDAAPAGVAVAVVREVRTAAAAQVEGGHVGLLEFAGTGCGDRAEEGTQVPPGRPGDRTGHIVQQGEALLPLAVRVAERERGGPHHPAEFAGSRRGGHETSPSPGAGSVPGAEPPVAGPPPGCPPLRRGGMSRAALPLPSQFSRLTRAAPLGLVKVSEVCRWRSAWKFSTATGSGPPDDSPNGPEPPMPGPSSYSREQASSSSWSA